MGTCRFCRDGELKQQLLVEGKWVSSFLDIQPASPGHFFIIPIRHVETTFALSPKEWNEIHVVLKKSIAKIRRINLEKKYAHWNRTIDLGKSKQFTATALTHFGLKKKPDAYTIGINEGEAAGRMVPHVHMHVIPRFWKDIPDPEGGIRRALSNPNQYGK